MATLVPLAVLVFWIGLFPNPLLTVMHGSVNELIEHVDQGDVLLATGHDSKVTAVSDKTASSRITNHGNE
jgi:hypothetical protein